MSNVRPNVGSCKLRSIFFCFTISKIAAVSCCLMALARFQLGVFSNNSHTRARLSSSVNGTSRLAEGVRAWPRKTTVGGGEGEGDQMGGGEGGTLLHHHPIARTKKEEEEETECARVEGERSHSETGREGLEERKRRGREMLWRQLQHPCCRWYPCLCRKGRLRLRQSILQ